MKLVIFDCDGTLVDSQHLIVACMNEAFASLRRQAPSREATLSIVGLSLHEAFATLTSPDDQDIPVLIEAYKSAFHAQRLKPDNAEPLYEGAREVVEWLAGEQVALGIATGKSQRGVRIVMTHHGLLDRFSTIQTADDAPSKPHPGMIQQAMAAVGAVPDETVMIGDTTYDIDMAHAAGVASIAVSWGYHAPQALLRSRPHALVGAYAEVPLVLKGLWGR
ncbi:MAG: phosphoglycolate phosphatase [Xanthobacteraceae bacterium]|nr:MAG: phosphoglycolate phosphatase [Xanthobacteraceae bacterium]